MNQKQRKEYFKNKIETMGLCKSIRTADINFYNELLELFKDHPDAPNKTEGLTDISILRHPKYKGLTLYIHLPTGMDDISYTCCITKRAPKQRHYREDIQHQINEYRSKATMRCMLCNVVNTEFHIDHIYPFSKILEDYNTQSNCDWVEYHKLHARFQVLCAKCNIKKTNQV